MTVFMNPDPPSNISIRAALLAETQRTLASFSRLQDEYDQAATDPDVIQEDRSTARLLAAQARRALSTARSALARFDDGTYGTCESCKAKISAQRLQAVPDTTTCLPCS